MSSGYTEIFAWGNDAQGQLGLAGYEKGKHYAVPRFCSFNVVVRSISCGEMHSGFITNNGLVYTIGSNSDGRLGIGDIGCPGTAAPRLVRLPTQTLAIEMSCGTNHTALIMENGMIYSWGLGDFSALGLGGISTQWSPARVPLPSTLSATQISCGHRHTALVTQSGQLWVWGTSDTGQLGTGARDVEAKFAQLPVTDEVAQVSCGAEHSLFCTRTGKVYAMGGNSFGQLGINNKKMSSIPLFITSFNRIFITKVAAGHHSAAISDQGELFVWGSGAFGEFLKPKKVRKLPAPIRNLALGGAFGAALDTQGHVWTWGNNSSGELGVGDYEARPTPELMNSLQGKYVTQIACGMNFAMALGEDVLPPNGSDMNKSEVLRSTNELLNESRAPRSVSPNTGRNTSDLTYKPPVRSRTPTMSRTESASSPKPLSKSRTVSSVKPSIVSKPRKLRRSQSPRPESRSPLKKDLSEVKNELGKLQKGSMGVEELSKIIERMQGKYESLMKDNQQEISSRKSLENQLIQLQQISGSEIQKQQERNASLVNMYESKIREIEGHVKESANEMGGLVDQHNKLQIEKEVSAEQISFFKSTMAKLEHENKGFHATIQSLTSKNQYQEDHIAELQARIKAQDESHALEVSRLEQNLSAAENNVGILQQQIENEQSRKWTLEESHSGELSRLEQNISISNQNYRILKENLQEVQAAHESTLYQLELKSSEYIQQSEELSLLQEEINHLTNCCQTLDEQHTDLSKTLEKQISKSSQVNTRASSLADENQMLAEENSALKMKSTALDYELAKIQDILSSTKSDYALWEVEKQGFQQKIGALELELTGLQAQLRDIRGDTHRFQDTLTVERRNANELAEENAKLRHNLEEIQNKNMTILMQIDEFKLEANTLKDTMKNLEQSSSSLQGQLADSNNKNAKKDAEKQGFQMKIASLEQEITSKQSQVRDLHDQNNQIQDSLNQERQSFTDVMSENRSLRQNLSEIQTNNSSILIQLDSFKEETLAYRSKLNVLEISQEKLQQALNSSQSENQDLRSLVEDVENKNKFLIEQLEKNLTDRARDYKTRTSGLLGSTISPTRNTSPLARTQQYSERTPRRTRSPILDRSLEKLRGETPVTHSGVSRLLDSQQTPERFSSQINPTAMDSIYEEDDCPTNVPEPDPTEFPARPSLSFRESFASQPDTSQTTSQLKSSLIDLKQRISSLQENKSMLQYKMDEFESSLHPNNM